MVGPSGRSGLDSALVGLDGVIAIGIVLGHEVTMLMGALGGFLAPTVSSLTNRNTPSSWGVRVLSPDAPIALALALMFGFSGRLFSSMAIQASSQLGGKSDDG